jgi:hypothetical protein
MALMAIIAHGIGPHHSFPRRPLWRKWWFWVIIVLVLIVVAAAAWIGLRALAAKSELEAAQAGVSKLKAEATAQNFSQLAKTFDGIKQHAAEAEQLTSDPIWRAGELVPGLGKNLRVVRELAAVTNDVVRNTVSPLVNVASGLSPASFAPVNGALNLAPLIEAIPAVAQADASIKSVTKTLNGIDTAGTVSQVAAGKTKLSSLLASVTPVLDGANTFLPLLPPFMGATAPRNYVIMFQNPAESRTLGGTALSFAGLTIDKGKLSLSGAVSAGLQNFPSYPQSVIPVPDGVQGLYEGAFGTFIANATVRPQFSSAAEIVAENWKRKYGTSVDGVISIDPVALSYILRATTPITLSSGDILTPDSLVPLLLNQVYQRYNTGHIVADNAAQDVIYGEAVSATFAKLMAGPLDLKLLIAAVLQGHTEGRLSYWSAHPAEETVLDKAKISGGLPQSDATTAGVGVYFQDNVGSKLNYYLIPTVHTGEAVCRTDGRETYRIGVDLTSTVPTSAKTLSPSILGNWKIEKLKPGVQRMYVYVYAPPGSTIAGASINGAPVAVQAEHDESYPVARLLVSISPSTTVSMSVDITAKDPGKKTLATQVTPTVNAPKMVPTPLDCSTVAAQ